MRRLLAAILLAMLALPATAAASPTPGFLDGFAALDPARWTPGDHVLGLSRLRPEDVTVADGTLRLGLPAGSTDGAEVRGTAALSGGTVRARMRVADAPSSLTGFFLYAPPDLASEIDIEILDDASGTVMFTTYASGRQTHTERRALGFDPTAGFHDYAIAWAPNRVTFTVDGEPMRTWTNGVPKAPMNLYANAWFPAWLAGTPPVDARATVIDEIEYLPR
jgi:beta-glucanase (GH16 family)